MSVTVQNNSGYKADVSLSLHNAALVSMGPVQQVKYGESQTFIVMDRSTSYFILGVNSVGQVRSSGLFKVPHDNLKYHEDLNIIIGNL